MSNTVTVSIGRNVGTEPMSASAWLDFRGLVDDAASIYATSVFVRDAVCWGSWEGIEEESRTWVFATDDEPSRIVETFAFLAVTHRQDAIAVTVGQTTLAGLKPAHVSV